MKLEIITTRSIDDKTGKAILTFRPVLIPDVTANGSLSFAAWQVWEDEPATHWRAQTAALGNARDVLRKLGNL